MPPSNKSVRSVAPRLGPRFVWPLKCRESAESTGPASRYAEVKGSAQFLEVCSVHLRLAGDPVHAALYSLFCGPQKTRPRNGPTDRTEYLERHGPAAPRERIDTDETIQFGGVGRRSRPHAISGRGAPRRSAELRPVSSVSPRLRVSVLASNSRSIDARAGKTSTHK